MLLDHGVLTIQPRAGRSDIYRIVSSKSLESPSNPIKPPSNPIKPSTGDQSTFDFLFKVRRRAGFRVL